MRRPAVVYGPGLDPVDRKLIHALQVDGRAPLSRIASVIGVPDRTLGHRFRRLTESSGLRVVGMPDSQRVGLTDWLVRIRRAGAAAPTLAGRLARRPEVSWVGVLAAGTEVTCLVRTPPGEEDTALRRALGAVPASAVVTPQCVLAVVAGESGWPVRTAALSGDEVAGLGAAAPEEDRGGPVPLQEDDWRLVSALSRDGRTGAARLAGLTGWSEASVRRRLTRLRSRGAVRFSVDVPPALFGYGLEAVLWLKVCPGRLPDASRALAADPEVAFAARTTGGGNLVAMVVCRNTPDLARYLTERTERLPGVLEAEAQPVVRRTKRCGIPAGRPYGAAPEGD
ncbi:Lrp/AsnC family transcriptional regulator [Streptomyces caatingaensis]|uniref:AsnC family transcriptional regulator n=1 Tax=Streptomyces caatingaensis TaxID=1678637 RepID=A0A0K9XK31_9ACTN|nr:Lrp/AsnC family transcriptional regulator [Streptomyces caatingaensis]KNB53724.1 hypothetical protein AC230_03710 [Streptomyces caatingaensis]